MSTTTPVHLRIAEVDGLEVFSLVDNSVDFLSMIDKKRGAILQTMDEKTAWPRMGKNTFPTAPCRAWLLNAYPRSLGGKNC